MNTKNRQVKTNFKVEFKVAEPVGRLDKLLVKYVPTLSRNQVKNLINKGYITVDGYSSSPSFHPQVNQLIKILIPEVQANETLETSSIHLPILYEDLDLIVIDKPAGLTVHPGAGQPNQTLANALVANYQFLMNVGGANRAGIVHRLDKETSGLLIVAKSQSIHSNISKQFEKRLVQKKYIALCHGKMSHQKAIIDVPIGRHPKNRSRMAPLSTGKDSVTKYEVVAQFKGFSLIELTPSSGRTHQIRVHLSAIGHPLVGDKKYGKQKHMLKRQFLHASFLKFQHPSKNELVEFCSELPEELLGFVNTLSPQ